MKWLIPAAALLLSTEVDALNVYSYKSSISCFVGSQPSRISTQSKQSNANICSSFLTNRKYLPSPHEHTTRYGTALPMGIRNILGLGKRSNKEEDNERSENPEDIRAALEAIKADLEAAADESKRQKKAPKQEKIKTEAILPDLKKEKKKRPAVTKRKQQQVEPTTATTYGETVRDRINRVKSGHMTDEEKAAFLNNALTRTPPGQTGPRIRQEIPPANGRKQASSSATPFPKDALWNTVIGNGKSSSATGGSPSRYVDYSLKGKDDSAKREYLDMVTNPDRFKSYAAMGGYKSKANDSLDENKPKTNGDVVDNLTMLDTPAPEETEDDLAKRLESAAILKEKQDAEAKAKKEEEEKARKAQLQEEQRKRSEEIRRLEQEKLAAKRAEEEKAREAEEEARKAEEKRLSDMQAAQDAYWAKKLEEENARKEKLLTPQEKALLEEKRKQDAAAALASAAREAAKQAEIEMLREEERLREDPNESEILEEDEASASFVEEQEKKKAALEEFMKEQNERLASLNSPLPFLGKKVPKVETSAKKTKPEPVVPRLNLTDLTMRKNEKKDSKVTPAPSPAPAAVDSTPRLNLAELTMAKKPAGSTPPAPAPPKPAQPDSSPRLSLAEMTMLKKPQTGGAPPTTPNRRPTTNTPSSGSRPIRQSIPITDDDEDEDDFFEYARGGGNSGMSIKDIMKKQNGGSTSGDSKSDAAKQQSKMWGIDIDKFMD